MSGLVQSQKFAIARDWGKTKAWKTSSVLPEIWHFAFVESMYFVGICPIVKIIFHLIMRNNAYFVRGRATLKDVERFSNNGLVRDLKEEQTTSMRYCDETSHDIQVESWKLLL